MRYIALEGIDGAGKDTQLALLARRLEVEGVTPIILHEPSFGEYGRRIRAGLHAFPSDQAEQRAMFTADRLDHVARKIRPLLDLLARHEDFAILQNRSLLSAAAYQPRGEGDAGLLATVEAELGIAPMPDAIIVLDLPVRQALERIDRVGDRDALERSEVLDACAARYRRLAALVPNCHFVDASGSVATVAASVLAALGIAASEPSA